MASIIFDVSKETVGKFVDGVLDNHTNSIMVLANLTAASVYAPTKKGKYKGYHRYDLQVLIPEDAIVGDGALGDFGASVLLRIPADRVPNHLKHDREGTTKE